MDLEVQLILAERKVSYYRVTNQKVKAIIWGIKQKRIERKIYAKRRKVN